MIEAHIFREVKNGIEFLLLKRNNNQIYPGLWQMVTGKIKDGETACQTALREIKEEASLRPVKLWVVPNVNSFYSHENDHISMLPVFAALVQNGSFVKISDEHCDFKWVNPEEAKKLLAWVGQRNSVDIITRYFTKEINFLNFIEIEF
jgi:dATP pyrophosphohydrolase